MSRPTRVNADELSLVLRAKNAQAAAASTAAVNAHRRPLEAANVGDTVQGQQITLTPAEVIAAKSTFDQKTHADPGYAKKLLGAAYPSDPKTQAQWALAYHRQDADKVHDALWSRATNDDRSEVYEYVHGVLEYSQLGRSVTTAVADFDEARDSFNALFSQDPNAVQTLMNQPLPSNPRQQLVWAFGQMFGGWDPDNNPNVVGNAKALAVLHFVQGMNAFKAENGDSAVPVLSQRRTITVDGVPHVYAVHTPPGPKPKAGWPTVVFFHGSFGGNAPEQQGEYQQANAAADAKGFQVLYPVGTPQDRADSNTGRGMLNWDPVNTGPGGANDRFVFEMLHKEINGKSVDPTRTFIAGHSQGGFYISDLIASYPKAFAAAEIMGAGTGSIAAKSNFTGLRHTPLLLHVGQNDIHLEFAKQLYSQLQAQGYGTNVTFETPANRGHEVLSSDFEEMFARFAATPPNATSDVLKESGRAR